jgi:hypothetical protein
MSGYTKMLMALTALVISGACFGVLRVMSNPNALIFGAAWLMLNLKFGCKRWAKRI